MKRRIFILISMLCGVLSTIGVEPVGQKYQYVSPDKWLAGVEQIPAVENLYHYDPVILREYFRHNKRTGADAIHWKLYGLAAFGNLADNDEVLSLVRQWTRLTPKDGRERFTKIRDKIALVIPARCGDEKAMRQLLLNGDEDAVLLLTLCHNQASMDRLAEIANDVKCTSEQRLDAICALAKHADQRGYDHLLSDATLQVISGSRSGASYQGIWWYITEISIPNTVDTPSKARIWLKNNPGVLFLPRKTITVKGGIDWSKVDWTKSPPQMKQS